MGQRSAGVKIKVLFITVTSYSLVLFRLVFLVSWARGQSCGPRVSARLLTEIPCDMGRSSYCTTPGSAYPWISVKKFIFENQGLVRRMYGDVTHGSVLRHEIDLENFRYDSIYFPDVRTRTGRARTGKNTKPNRRRPRPQIFSDDLTTTTEDPSYYETIFRVVTQTSMKFGTDATTASYTTISQPTSQERFPEPPTTHTVTETTEPTISDTNVQQESTTSTLASSKTTLSISPLNTFKLNVTDEISDADSFTEKTVTAVPRTETTDAFEERLDTKSTGTESDDRKFDPANDYDYIPLTRIEIISDNSLEAKSYAEDDLLVEEEEADDTYEVKIPDEQPAEAKDKMPEEDIAESPPKRGINACPVKNEVIAPYWANNTRGETLALLNVYPFEQYVHFEKCAFENHQMLCREGCRCEQQFRLHRLLAFDPKNECRGIFSDWFRFPSCCVCICYDIVTEPPNLRSRTGRLKKEDRTS